jgi:hypothetical protein
MITNFSEYDELKILFEDLNFSFDIEWEKQTEDEHIGYFDEEKYQIEIINLIDNNWFFKFYRWDDKSQEYVSNINLKDEQLSSKDASNVLGTIRHTILEFVKDNKPQSISFIAADESKSRKSLYNLFSNELVNKFLYKKIVYELDDYKIFVLYTEKNDKIKIRKAIFDKYGLLF